MRKTINVNKAHYWIILMMLVLAFSSCRKPPVVPNPSDFTKAKREHLGDLVKVAISANPDNFPVLPLTNNFDSTYWYIQKLYNQVTRAMRVDGFAPADNRWDSNRDWQVTIINKDELKTAFITPGGHIYLSTGLLKSLTKENQLYYILAFEATLMNDDFLFHRLVNQFNTTTLDNLLNGIPSNNEPTLNDIAEAISNIEFDTDVVEIIDRRAISLICKTSIFDRSGIISVLDLLDETDTKWLQTRKSYEVRDQLDFILNLPVNPGGDCGTFVSNGGYQKYILEKLD